jgi:hypothetical protein
MVRFLIDVVIKLLVVANPASKQAILLEVRLTAASWPLG